MSPADTNFDGQGTDPTQPPAPCPPPKLEGAPDFPQPGIYFGMSEEEYHAIHACSASGLKNMLASSMDYWANSALNPDRHDDDTEFKKLGRAYHVRILLGREVFNDLYYPALHKKTFGDRLVDTVKEIRAAIKEDGGEPKGNDKSSLILQLMERETDHFIWDIETATWAGKNEGKEQISQRDWDRIQIAAAMIEKDEQLSHAFSEGHPEVALFWYDEATGAPMKAKVDYLKMNAFSDLKSFGNPLKRPVKRAIDFAIANQKYYLPVVVYLEGIAAVKKLVRESGGRLPFWIYDEHEPVGPKRMEDYRQWVWAWAHQPEPEALFVFQQTGHAPVTRGRHMRKGTVYELTRIIVQQLKAKWVECAKTYGTDPWIDSEPITATTDEDMPLSATDFGE